MTDGTTTTTHERIGAGTVARCAPVRGAAAQRRAGRTCARRGGYLTGAEPRHYRAGFLERIDTARRVRAARCLPGLLDDGTRL